MLFIHLLFSLSLLVDSMIYFLTCLQWSYEISRHDNNLQFRSFLPFFEFHKHAYSIKCLEAMIDKTYDELLLWNIQSLRSDLSLFASIPWCLATMWVLLPNHWWSHLSPKGNQFLVFPWDKKWPPPTWHLLPLNYESSLKVFDWINRELKIKIMNTRKKKLRKNKSF